MLNKKHKLLEIKTSAIVDSLFVGNYKTNHKGRGIEFATFKEYDISDNVKNIDFVRSEKEGKILVKLYEEEKELSVYFVIDLNNTFFDSGFGFNKIDIVYELLYLVGLSALKNGDKVGMYINNSDNYNINLAKKGKNNFVNIINILDKYSQKKLEKINFLGFFKQKLSNNNHNINVEYNFGLKYFNSLSIKNSLVFYLTDSLEIDKKQLKVLGVKNDLVLCNIFNSIENDLHGIGIGGFKDKNNSIILDFDNKSKINEYIELRISKINELRKFILKNGGKYLLLDENKNIYKEFYNLFK
ncbi:MAG: DUF58 domain-containing protein [Candidatus Gracilibacteria bacterium]|nr:DUF58 domain-containing protein [Candidatus Gracilibacteria bacterium]